MLFISAQCLLGQEPVFKQFTTKDGLPSNEAHFVFSDSKGYIWICTDGGITKYNANIFKVFNTSNGLLDNTVFEVKEDKSGKIWYRTFNNSVGYIFNDSVHVIGAGKAISAFAEEGRISSFGIEDNGDLYIGKQNLAGCNFLKVSPPYSSSDVKLIGNRKTNNCGIDVLILKNKNIVFTEARNARNFGPWYKINILDKELKVLLADSFDHYVTSPVSRFSFEKNILYYTSKNTLRKYDLNTRSVETSKKDISMLGLYVHHDSILMLGSLNKGIYCYDKHQKKELAHFLNGASVTCITRDFQNGIWVSTLEKGIFYYGYEDPVKYQIEGEDGHSVTYLVADKENNLYAGFFNGNVYKLNYSGTEYISQEKIYPPVETKVTEPISLFIQLSPEKYFIGDNRKNVLYTKKTKQVKEVKAFDQVFKFGFYNKNNLLFFGVNDFFKSDTNCEKLERIAHFNDRVSGFSLRENDIYACGLKGLYKFDSITKKFIKDPRFNTRIEDVKKLDGRIYLATKFEGVIILNGNKIDTLSEKNGLISNICRSILIDGKNVWVSSNTGVTRVTCTKNNSYEIMNYSLNYFVDAVDIREMCLLNGFMFFYSGNTIYAFQTNRLNLHESCRIKEISVKGEVKDLSKKIILPYNSSDIRLTFEALFYNLKGKISYRYKYKHDADWVYTNESTVNLGSLLQGNHMLKVEALNINNIWVPSSNVIYLQVEKPFWQSAYFIVGEILLSSLVISAFLLFLNRRKQKAEKKKQEMNIKMIELEAKTVRSLMNPHFVFNSLNTLHRFILESDLENAENYLTKFSKLLRKLMESGTVDKISVEDEVEILSKYLYIEKLRFDSSFDYKIEVGLENSKNVYIPFMLVQPFVENAVWHGLMPKSGDKFLSISFIKLGNDRIRCMIDDNGIGREASAARKNILKNKSMAIELIKQRLEIMQKLKGIECKFNIWDKKDENLNATGTLVEIILPIIN